MYTGVLEHNFSLQRKMCFTHLYQLEVVNIFDSCRKNNLTDSPLCNCDKETKGDINH